MRIGIYGFGHDGDAVGFGVEFGDVGGDGDEFFFEVEAAEGGFHGACEGEAVSGETFCAGDEGAFFFGENGFDGAKFGGVADGGGGGVGVDVVDLFGFHVCGVHGEFHGAGEAFAVGFGGEDVEAVGGLRPASDFGVDFCVAFLGEFEFFDDEDTAAAGADEAVAFFVEGAGGEFGVFLWTEGADACEGQDGKFIAVFGADDEDAVLLAAGDEVVGRSEGVGG